MAKVFFTCIMPTAKVQNFHADSKFFGKKIQNEACFFPKHMGVGVEVGDSYLLGTCFSITYLLETLCTSRFQQFKVGVGYKTKEALTHC